jgi:cell division protein ZapA (FtsZ GTPase activity inhibitor)
MAKTGEISMTNDTRFDDIYTRLNDLTQDVTNLKIQSGTIGTSQTAIATTLTLATGLASDMREVKADVRQIKSDIRNLEASISEILRLLRSQ